MSLIGNIDNIPVFTSIAEAELWGSQYNITGHHTHTILGVTGYMAGTTHADITSANLTVVVNPITPQQLMQATGSSSTPSSITTTSSGSSGSGGY
jgi:hypothetical protein|tara:strand:+ start:217 stop:501 length:285 start_codon:yes stop_codon:yes gene_type:complete